VSNKTNHILTFSAAVSGPSSPPSAGGAGHDRRQLEQVQKATALSPVMTCSRVTKLVSPQVGHAGCCGYGSRWCGPLGDRHGHWCCQRGRAQHSTCSKPPTALTVTGSSPFTPPMQTPRDRIDQGLARYWLVQHASKFGFV
jgi:hypothetical protein